LQVIPAEVLMRPGDKQSFRLRGIDATGQLTAAPEGAPSWQPFVPPTARVQSRMDAAFNEAGELVAGENAANSAGAFEVKVGELKGTIRGRVLQSPPYAEDFNGFELSESGADGAYAHPPLPWIGARMKWQVREHEG